MQHLSLLHTVQEQDDTPEQLLIKGSQDPDYLVFNDDYVIIIDRIMLAAYYCKEWQAHGWLQIRIGRSAAAGDQLPAGEQKQQASKALE